MRFSLVLVAMVFGCGGGSSDPNFDNRDPRCVSACTDDPPSIEGAGDVCTTASQVDCVDECEARIAGVMTVCASCLLEDACFDPKGCGPVIVDPPNCDQTECTITGRNGSCSFPVGNEAAAEDCERQVNPRREVACTPDFRSTSECENVCS